MPDKMIGTWVAVIYFFGIGVLIVGHGGKSLDLHGRALPQIRNMAQSGAGIALVVAALLSGRELATADH